MRFNVDNFRGLAPRINPKRVDPGVGIKAVDVDLDNQTIKAWREGKLVHEADHEILSFIRADCCWLTFDKCVDLVYPMTPSCPYVIATGVREYPTIALPEEACRDEWCRLGLPCPELAPIAIVQGAATPGVAMEYRGYRYAYKNKYGQIGGGSPPSQVMNVTDGQTVIVSGFSVPDPEWCVETIMLYRLATPFETGLENSNPQNTEYFFLAEFPVGQPAFIDSIRNIDLGGPAGPNVFTNDEYLPPPADLHSIVSLENGRLAGISGELIFLSSPNEPHAWLIRYIKKLLDKPVALASIGAALYAGTNGHPYFIDGSNDCQGDGCQQVLKSRVPLPCVSKRSMVAESDFCYYASTDGLVSISNGQAKVISQTHIADTDWQALRPNRMIGAWRAGFYHGYTDVAGIRFRGVEGQFAIPQDIAYTNLSERPSAVWRDNDGELYYAIGNKIYLWNGGDRNKEYFFKTTPHYFARRENLSAAMIEREKPGRLNFKMETDLGVVLDRQVDSQETFRLPGKSSAAFVSFEFRGTAEVFQITAGTSLAERIASEAKRAA